MKRLLKIFVVLLSMALAAPAFANGYGRHGGHHGGYGHHHGGGWGNHWVGPVLGAAIVGSAIMQPPRPLMRLRPLWSRWHRPRRVWLITAAPASSFTPMCQPAMCLGSW